MKLQEILYPVLVVARTDDIVVKYFYLVFSLDLKLPILCSSDNVRPYVALFSSLSQALQYATLPTGTPSINTLVFFEN